MRGEDAHKAPDPICLARLRRDAHKARVGREAHKARLGRDAHKALCYLMLGGVFLMLFGCRATPTPEPSIHFRIRTADSAQYVARETANAYLRAHPTTTFDFFNSNSTMTLRQLGFDQTSEARDKTFAFVERNPRADELERAHATAYELGRDGVFVIVHPSNALKNLSQEDLKKILTGEFNEWSQLGVPPPGGKDDIQVLMREDGSGMRAVMEEKILQGARVTPTALVQPTDLDMLDYVSDHPNAIGYAAANIWDGSTGVRAIGIDNIAATRANIATGVYPLLQSVFLIVPQNPSQEISSFVEFLASGDGRAVLYRRISEIPPK